MTDFVGKVSALEKGMSAVSPRLCTPRTAEDVAVFEVDPSLLFPHLFKRRLLVMYVSEAILNDYRNEPHVLNDLLLGDKRLCNFFEDLILIVLDKIQNWPNENDRSGFSSVLSQQPKIPYSILASAKPSSLKKTLTKHLVEKAPIDAINPYSINTHTSHRMFFGRQGDLDRLSSDRDHRFIFGPRRIGKSSLVKAFRAKLNSADKKKDNIFEGTHSELSSVSYVDVSNLLKDYNYEEKLWESILRGFGFTSDDLKNGSRIRRLVARNKQESRTPIFDLGLFLERLTETFRPTIILDEVDGLIEEEVETGWKIMERLRAISENGRLRIFLVGYESLYLATMDDRFPLYERGKSHLLTPIDRNAVKSLIREPLSDVEATYEDVFAVENRILETSGGMPHVVQDICKGIFELYLLSIRQTRSLDRSKVRISMTDVEAAIDQSKAVGDMKRGNLVKDFPLAEAIAGITSLGDFDEEPNARKNVTLPQIINQLEEIGFKFNRPELELALAYLKVRGILQPHDSEETVWSWMNSVAKRGQRVYIDKMGYKRWSKEIFNRHEEGGWKKRYRRYNQI